MALIQLILRISDFKANLEHLRGPMERASDAQKTPRKKPDTFSRPSHENFSEVDTPPSSEVEELSQDLKEDSKTFFKSLLNNIKDDKVPDLGAQTTYYLVLALFPFFIFLLSVLQYTPLEYEIIISTLEGLLPEDAHELIFGTIEEVFTASSGALLSFGALAALWSSLKGANALIKGVNTAYNVEETRNFFQVKAVALLTTIGVPIVILSAFFFIVFGEVLGTYVFDFFGLSDYFIELWNWMRFPIPMLIMVLFFMVFYKFAPNQKLKFRNVFWGALFTVIFWIIASLGFSFYVNNFSNYSAVYGSLGTIVVVLLWLYISSIIIIVGGEVNVVLSRLRRE
ncbi:YihY/virulence factor BrkB family protein [Isachenkonia alkalipeptolytica]|uniref:YihY/virulence factor BrkB family protein n=1 Tax=Isachenkonia alkalipeptolytica TaxID=2565777 RepID=UPI00136D564E